MKICQKVWYTEVYPEKWNLDTLVQLDKGKGCSRKLENKRYIHIKDELSKLFSHIVISSAKNYIQKHMSKFQIGSKKGHRPEENVFVISSFLALCESRRKAVILQIMD